MAVGAALAMATAAACSRPPGPDPALQPDSVLRAELGLGDADQVHRVEIRGGAQEQLAPAEIQVPQGHWVEFVTADWRVHEVRFEVDSLDADALDFLAGTDQVDSPPLIELGARFVVSFADAPEGRYPYLVEGNALPARGVVVVLPKR